MYRLCFIYAFYCLIHDLNESARAHNEPTWADFLALVKITSQPELARYLNEPAGLLSCV
jgi:hypothetical protein